jgi:hypothetical protein
MTEQAPCPLCRQENPPGNRFCGSCGVQLTSGEQLARRQEHSPFRVTRAWPAKLGPVGKALAVGAAVMAAEAGLSWLQRRIDTEERSSLPAVRDADLAWRGYLLGLSLEDVLVGAWEDSRGLVVARREVRSFVSTGPTVGKGRTPYPHP